MTFCVNPFIRKNFTLSLGEKSLPYRLNEIIIVFIRFFRGFMLKLSSELAIAYLPARATLRKLVLCSMENITMGMYEGNL